MGTLDIIVAILIGVVVGGLIAMRSLARDMDKRFEKLCKEREETNRTWPKLTHQQWDEIYEAAKKREGSVKEE